MLTIQQSDYFCNMTREELINDYLQDIAFYEMQLGELLAKSGVLTDIDRLAIWTNINKIKELREKIAELMSK